MSFNKIIIVGNLGRDPELRYTPQGTAVCDFSVATNERRKDPSGESKDETTWFRVTFWGRQAEVASQYLSKGRQVYIEGRLRAREWTDKDGRVRTSLEVVGTELQMLGSRGDDTAIGGGASQAKTATKNSEADFIDQTVTEDDIPF
ncbi:MAG: single-stranded DNA-binding protein [Acidobacteriota bacterium]